MKTVTKINIITVAAIAVIAAIMITMNIKMNDEQDAPDTASLASSTHSTSHRLNVANDGAVEFVEFVDFECEVCGAVYPYLEQLRADYGDGVSFVIRYFPLPGHHNSMNAALAVEAAAQQGAFELMYAKMFDTQTEWGEQKVSKASLFRQYAADLGLDLPQYDVDVAAASTLDRVQLDFDAGQKLGVNATPTFFANDQKLLVESIDDLRAALDAAIK